MGPSTIRASRGSRQRVGDRVDRRQYVHLDAQSARRRCRWRRRMGLDAVGVSPPIACAACPRSPAPTALRAQSVVGLLQVVESVGAPVWCEVGMPRVWSGVQCGHRRHCLPSRPEDKNPHELSWQGVARTKTMMFVRHMDLHNDLYTQYSQSDASSVSQRWLVRVRTLECARVSRTLALKRASAQLRYRYKRYCTYSRVSLCKCVCVWAHLPVLLCIGCIMCGLVNVVMACAPHTLMTFAC